MIFWLHVASLCRIVAPWVTSMPLRRPAQRVGRWDQRSRRAAASFRSSGFELIGGVGVWRRSEDYSLLIGCYIFEFFKASIPCRYD